MADKVKWVESVPGSVNGGIGLWPSRLVPLQERPGHWAEIHRGDSYYSLKMISVPYGTTKTQWEVACRKDGETRAIVVYARFLG